MGQRLFRTLKAVFNLILIPAFALPGCQKSSYFSASTGPGPSAFSGAGGPVGQLASGNGNGKGFEGGIARYVYLDPIHPCSEKGVDGKSVPNQEIALISSYAGQSALLLRNNCVALNPPASLNISDLQFATDGSGDLTYQGDLFMPQSPATNLLKSTQQFDGTAWGKQNVLITPNAALAPDGTLTADRVSQDTVADWHTVSQTVSYAPGSTVTFSVFAKGAGLSNVWLADYGDPSYSDHICSPFYLNSGTDGMGTPTGTTTPVGISITPYPNGWYRLALSAIPSATASSLQVDIYIVQPADIGNSAGDGVSGVYLWGAQLEQGPSVSGYVPN